MNLAQLPANMQAKISVELCEYTDHCWMWNGALNSRGYGCVAVKLKSQLTHRVAYELIVGPIGDGLQIDHLCRNRRCCNPAHLEPVSALENTRRALDVRGRPRCRHGHPMAGPNLVIRHRYGYEYRTCRMCQIAVTRESRARRSGGTRLRRRPAVLPVRDAELLAKSEAALAALVGAA